MLEIQKILREKGLEKTKELLNLTVNKKDDGRVLLKYKHIEADWTLDALHECRGIILDENNYWEVISYPFNKFFNLGEVWCKEMDWESTKWMKKEDGSIMTLYYWNGWKTSSSSMIDADGIVGYNSVNTMNDLFIKSVNNIYGSLDGFYSMLDKNRCYMFELMTPENIVVTQHKDYNVVLHGCRDLDTLKEINIFTDEFKDFKRVEVYNISNAEEARKLVEEMPWDEEGYVAVDKYFNRVKIKNRKYVDMAFTAMGTSPYAIVNVVKEDEVSEYTTYFQNRKEDLYKYKEIFDNYLNRLTDLYDETYTEFISLDEDENKHRELNKEYYYKISTDDRIEKMFKHLFYELRRGYYKNMREAMCSINNKEWLEIFDPILYKKIKYK